MGNKNSDWGLKAAAAIFEAHKTVPEGADLKARKAIIDAAHPFGERRYYPYKAWLAERRRYLKKHGYLKPGKQVELTPLEALMQGDEGAADE